jgi:hypothetical protein
MDCVATNEERVEGRGSDTPARFHRVLSTGWGAYRHVAAVLGAFSMLVFFGELLDLGWRGILARLVGVWSEYVRPSVEWIFQCLTWPVEWAFDWNIDVPLLVRDYVAVGLLVISSGGRASRNVTDAALGSRTGSKLGKIGYVLALQILPPLKEWFIDREKGRYVIGPPMLWAIWVVLVPIAFIVGVLTWPAQMMQDAVHVIKPGGGKRLIEDDEVARMNEQMFSRRVALLSLLPFMYLVILVALNYLVLR